MKEFKCMPDENFKETGVGYQKMAIKIMLHSKKISFILHHTQLCVHDV